MTALDQVFIKAYIQHAGMSKDCPERPEEPDTLGQQLESQPEGLPAQTSSAQGDQGAGGEAAGPKTSGEPRPSRNRPSGKGSPKAVSSGTASGGTASGKKKASQPRRLPLVEALEEEDRQVPVGLPNRRTLEKLGSSNTQAGPPPPTPIPRPHFLSISRRTIPFRSAQPQTPTTEELGSEAEAPLPEPEKDSAPECVLDFTSSLVAESSSQPATKESSTPPAGKEGEKKQKLPKNPRKVTLTDLDIPREVCFFEPPSPTIPLDSGQERVRVRGRPEMVRPSEPPRLSLFAPEVVSKAPSGKISSGRTTQGAGCSGSTLSARAESEKGLDEFPPQGLLRLCRPPEAVASPAPQEASSPAVSPASSQSSALAGAQAVSPVSAPASSPAGSLGGSPTVSPVSAPAHQEPRGGGTTSKPVPEEAAKAFFPHWRAPQLVWPKVCLALETKAEGALDRVAEAILSATREGKKVFGFLSPRTGEGATTLLLCTARRLAARGCRVLLADGNLVHPDLADRLSLVAEVGWEEAAGNSRRLEEIIIESMTDSVAVLPRKGSREAVSDRSELVLSAVWPGLEQLRNFYDMILVDLGALEHLGGEQVLSGKQCSWPVEGMVLVRNVRVQDATDISTLRQRLQAGGMPVVGVVDNCV